MRVPQLLSHYLLADFWLVSSLVRKLLLPSLPLNRPQPHGHCIEKRPYLWTDFPGNRMQAVWWGITQLSTLVRGVKPDVLDYLTALSPPGVHNIRLVGVLTVLYQKHACLQVREFEVDTDTLLYLKWKTNKDLLTQYRELCSMLCNNGKIIWKIIDTCRYMYIYVTQSCPTLCDSMDCSLPGSSVHGISHARILDWGAIPFSKGIFLTQGSNSGLLHCRQILYLWATRAAPLFLTKLLCCRETITTIFQI